MRILWSSGDNIEFAFTADEKEFTTATGFAATLKSGEDKLTIPGTSAAETKTKINFSYTVKADDKLGVYTLSEVKDTTTSPTFTFTVPTEPKTSCRVTEEVAIAAAEKQTAAQTVKEGDDTENSFTLVFASKLTIVPVIYGKSDGKVEIAGCELDTADTEGLTVKCSPEGEELAKGENTIYYQKGCATTPETTGVKVTYTPKEAGSFITFGKIALFVIAAVLL